MANFLASASLFAPLAVASFALAYAVLIGVPGYALASLARPAAPRTERLALAIPCAYGIVAICGLATALLHLPFDLVTYGIVALPITLLAAYIQWRQHTREGANPAPDRWWLAPVSVAVIQLGVVALVFAHATVPTGIDAVMHVLWTDRIAQSHLFPIALLSAHPGSSDGAFYPPVFHALAALIVDATSIAPYRAVFFSTVAAVALLPLMLFSFVRSATGQARIGALAAVAALAFEPLPLFVLAQSLYPFTVSLLIVPAVALTVRDGLGRGDRRSLLLAAILGIALFYTHPTEFVTVALLALGIGLGLLRSRGAWFRAIRYGLVLGCAWGLAALPALQAIRRTMVDGAQTEIRARHDFTPPAHVHLSDVIAGYAQWIYGRDLGYILLAAVILGIVWCLYCRRHIGLVAAQAFLFVVFIDTNTYNVLRPLYTVTFPWAMGDRLPPTHYWFALPLAALGLDALLRAGARRFRAAPRSFVAIIAAPVVILGLALPAAVSASRIAIYTQDRTVAGPADLDAIAWLRQHSAGAITVLDDADLSPDHPLDVPIDAGLWLPVLGGPQPVFWRLGAGPGTTDKRAYVLRHIADMPWPDQVARYVDKYAVRYVYYGAVVRPHVPRHLDLRRLLSSPETRLVYSSAASCLDGDTRDTAACPASASYVFALRQTAALSRGKV